MPWVAGSQAGEDLSCGAEVLLHLLFFDGLLFFYKLAGLHAMGIKLEKKDGMVDMREVGIKPDTGAVVFPLGPVGTVQLGITGRDSRFHCLPDSTVVSAHLSANVRGECCHNFSAGI